MINKYRVLGVMSGTSLDGLDIAQCLFTFSRGKWNYKIERAITYEYSVEWKHKLSVAENLSGVGLILLTNEFGLLMGNYCNSFLGINPVKIDFIASHGHTVFHQPDKGLTFQIGNGACVSAVTGLTTICDFRNQDVALGGQGAPLVPVGNALLFSDFAYCLNIGGFCNISFETSSARVAFDICPANIVSNDLVKERNLLYDLNGAIARKGNIHTGLLTELNGLPFYKISGPKSLGKEWVLDYMQPVLNKYPISLEDKLRTYYQHVADQVTEVVSVAQKGRILITGGGAHNLFLTELLTKSLPLECVVPQNEIIDFKEALVFAFLGVLCYRNEVNCLRSVTGAKKDHVGGVIFRG